MNVAVDFRIPDDNILIEQVPRTKAAIEAERGDQGTKTRWDLQGVHLSPWFSPVEPLGGRPMLNPALEVLDVLL